MKTENEFGDQTYWNRPTQGRRKKLLSKYPSLKQKVKATKAKSSSRSPSPTPSHASSTRTIITPSHSAHIDAHKSNEEDADDKDEKSIVKLMKSKLPQYSNE